MADMMQRRIHNEIVLFVERVPFARILTKNGNST